MELTKSDQVNAVEGSTALVPQTIAITLEPLRPVMDLAMAKERLAQFQEFVSFYLKEGEDYGTIPGVKKPSLWKAGADKLCELYGLEETYTELRVTENWDTGLFDYTIHCALGRNGLVRGVGVGSCSSYESKYRYRDAQRKCPNCGNETIIKGKEEWGGGWLCWTKRGGCGAKFPDQAPEIIGQQVGRVTNPDISDVKNTIIKMAKKRAKIDATLAATRSSGIFTQDVEDLGMVSEEPVHEAPAPAPVLIPPSRPRNANGNGSSTALINATQKRAFWSAVKQGAKSEKQVLDYFGSIGIERTEEMRKADFDNAMKWALSSEALQ